jgi:integrase
MTTQGTPTPSRWGDELLAQGYSRATVRAQTLTVERAARHAGVEPAELTRVQVLAWLGSAERATWTRLKYISWLRAWGRWAGLPELVEGIRQPRAPRGVPRPVSEQDLAALLGVCRPGTRRRAWVLLGAWCGLRAHESAKVAAEDLEQLPDGSWLLRVTGKGQQLAVVPCPPVVMAELRPWITRTGTGRLWPAASSATVQQAVRQAAARAGVACTSHQLRHRYGTACYSQSRDLLVTQQLMRHASPATTAGYAAVAGDRVHAVVASLPGAVDASELGPGRPRLRLVR